MKLKLLLILQFCFHFCFCQYDINFETPINLFPKENISKEIKDGISLSAIGLVKKDVFGTQVINVVTKDKEGKIYEFDAKKISSFIFIDNTKREQIWEKYLLKNGGYVNLLTNGLQYDIREDLNTDAIEYISLLEKNNLLFEDQFFEDYLYTVLNKVHVGTLKDKRPGNIYIKILKNVEPQAFCLSNGCIVISTGLLSTIQSEDELIGVLSHEVAHFILDHQLLNYNKEIERSKRAAFWSTLATVVAAGVDVALAASNEYHVFGAITGTVALASKILSDDIVKRLGVKFNQSQELEADALSQEICEILKYDKLGLSAALMRIKEHCVKTGNYLSLFGSETHPSLDKRISILGNNVNFKDFVQSNYLKKASFINSYNSLNKLYNYSNHSEASELATRNIENGVGTETDYLVKSIVISRTNNSNESNEQALKLIQKAKSLKITPVIYLDKQEGLIFLRLNRKQEAKISFQNYLSAIQGIKNLENKNYQLVDEIEWTKKMLFKIDVL